MVMYMMMDLFVLWRINYERFGTERTTREMEIHVLENHLENSF